MRGPRTLSESHMREHSICWLSGFRGLGFRVSSRTLAKNVRRYASQAPAMRSNPRMRITDIRGVCAIAHKSGAQEAIRENMN